MGTDCIVCAVVLTPENWAPECQRNHVNKCRKCIRAEKRAYHKQWNAAHPGSVSERTKRSKKKLRAVKPIVARARDAYGDCRKRAIRQGMAFDLTSAHVVGLFESAKTCPYFGWKLTHAIGKERTLASLDRIDSARGYTKDNVWVISYLANLMKSYATDAELVLFASGVLRHAQDNAHGAMRSYDKAQGTSPPTHG